MKRYLILSSLTGILLGTITLAQGQDYYRSVDYGAVTKNFDPTNPRMTAGSAFIFYHVNFVDTCADGKTSGGYRDEQGDYSIVISNSYGHVSTPSLPASIISFKVESNCDKHFKLIDRSFYNWLGTFAQQKGIMNTTPRMIKDWYDIAPSIERMELDSMVMEYGVPNYEVLFSNCPSHLINSTRHDPWSIVHQVIQPFDVHDRLVIGSHLLEDNAGNAFKGMGHMKVVTSVSMEKGRLIRDTEYSPLKYFKCEETIIRSWNPPTLITSLSEGDSVVMDQLIEVDEMLDIDQYVFRIKDTLGVEVARVEKSAPHFSLSEVGSGILDHGSRYTLETGSMIGHTDGPFGDPVTFELAPEVFYQYYAISSGDWNNPEIWSLSKNGSPCHSVPGTADHCFIDGHTVTIEEDVHCGKVLLTNQEGDTQLKIENALLLVNEDVSVEKAEGSSHKVWLSVKRNGKLKVNNH